MSYHVKACHRRLWYACCKEACYLVHCLFYNPGHESKKLHDPLIAMFDQNLSHP